MTNVTSEPARASSMETLAYTCALDLCGAPEKALSLGHDLLKTVRRSGLKSPFADALLRRLALAEWTKRDRPRPTRLDSRDPKEAATLLFFIGAWGVTTDDLAVALAIPEDRVRHLLHKARMEQVAGLIRIPIPSPECRRPRELLSDFHEARLAPVLADEVEQHLKDCRDCRTVDASLRTVLARPPVAPVPPPQALGETGHPRPTAWLSLDGVSAAKRRAGVVLLAVGLAMGAVQLHPGLNGWASANLDRMGATVSRWRGRGERLMQDLRVMKALALGTAEGRTEELSQTLDEYVNSDNEAPDAGSNKPAPDAVMQPRETKTQGPRP